MLGTEETPEMSLAMELKPFQSKQAYEGAAKAALMKHHVDAGRVYYKTVIKVFVS